MLLYTFDIQIISCIDRLISRISLDTNRNHDVFDFDLICDFNGDFP